MAVPLRRGRGASVAPDGAMPLLEHLRELRQRLFVSVLAIVVATVLAALFYDQLLALLQRPFEASVRPLAEEEGINASLTITTVSGPLTLLLKTAVVTGLVAASPVWLYQLWAFVVPALHRSERRWTLLFTAVAGPLFMGGVLVGYYVLPKGIAILISFTPVDVANLVDLSSYLSFVLRMLLVFGVAFEIPLFVVMLNLAGVVSGRALGEHRPWIIVGTFVFAAVATPSTDPVSMLFLALPMTLLFVASEVIARFVDRRRARSAAAYDSDAVTSTPERRHDTGAETYVPAGDTDARDGDAGDPPVDDDMEAWRGGDDAEAAWADDDAPGEDDDDAWADGDGPGDDAEAAWADDDAPGEDDDDAWADGDAPGDEVEAAWADGDGRDGHTGNTDTGNADTADGTDGDER